MDYPTSPGASLSKPFSIDHTLGPSFVSGGQQYLRCPKTLSASLNSAVLEEMSLRRVLIP